ncbi:hypothetical protein HmCmsJML164_01458 [Escherichia coli]|nr:hypothetical protein HmCmsJML164_01458 [Escherichia coli]
MIQEFLLQVKARAADIALYFPHAFEAQILVPLVQQQ